MKITANLLRRHRACREQVKLFEQTFPRGAAWPEDESRAREAGLDITWALAYLPIPLADVTERLPCIEGGVLARILIYHVNLPTATVTEHLDRLRYWDLAAVLIYRANLPLALVVESLARLEGWNLAGVLAMRPDLPRAVVAQHLGRLGVRSRAWVLARRRTWTRPWWLRTWADLLIGRYKKLRGEKNEARSQQG